MSRPRSIPGLALHLAVLRKTPALGCAFTLLGLVLLFCAIASRCAGSDAPRIATFNIRDFPRDARQIEGAFEIIDQLDAPIVAVQEITDPPAFARAASERLGPHHRFVHHEGRALHYLGVLYDSEALTLAHARTHDETRVTPNAKPVLEVRLRRAEGRAIRVFVVHLKAGGAYADVRREQLRQLAAIVAPVVESTWDEIFVLGDFNATGPDDRAALALFARTTRLEWASEALECTSYWDRSDGCRGSALDHVFLRRSPRSVRARGPCEEIGCAPADECPLFHRDVSDHCPVTIDP